MAGDHHHGPADPKAEALEAHILARIKARASATKTSEYPNWPSSQSAGTLPMSIAGRFKNERERLGPDFTEADRQWRIKWYKDQNLHPNEPYYVPELERALFNPLRRLYRAPLNYVERSVFTPYMGPSKAWIARKLIGLGVMSWMVGTYMWYSLKYNNANNWERFWGWRIKYTRPAVYPGDPAYPLINPRPESADFLDRGFKERKVLRMD